MPKKKKKNRISEQPEIVSDDAVEKEAALFSAAADIDLAEFDEDLVDDHEEDEEPLVEETLEQPEEAVDPVVEEVKPPVILEDKRILLKMVCTALRGCCGRGSKVKTRYAIIDITRNSDGAWDIVDHTPSTGNIMQLTKKYRKKLWRGSVFSMGLHEDPIFMEKVMKCDGLYSDRCKVVK